MATPPTFVAEYESAWNSSTSPKTASVTVANGDVLCCIAATGDGGATLSTPTGGTGITWTLQQSVVIDANWCAAYIWTAPITSGQTYTHSITRSGTTTVLWGFDVLRWSGSDGVGASAKTNVTSGAPSLAVTTLQDNSAVVMIDADWSALNTARTYRTINSITPVGGGSGEVSYFADAVNYGVYGAYWSDVGTAGSKTTGLTAPNTQKYSIIAVEVKGAAAAAASHVFRPRVTQAVQHASNW